MPTHCCNKMATEAMKGCPDQVHKDRLDCPEVVIGRCPDGHLGILVRDSVGAPRYSEVNFCPWCGALANR